MNYICSISCGRVLPECPTEMDPDLLFFGAVNWFLVYDIYCFIIKMIVIMAAAGVSSDFGIALHIKKTPPFLSSKR